MDAFEKTAWAGLDFDRYAWTAVLHREEGGGTHVHVLAARCDLETGRLEQHVPVNMHVVVNVELGSFGGSIPAE